MLNNTKNFVDYLDTFDKNSQQTYKKRLVKDIDETFTNTYNEPVEEEFVLNSPLGLNFFEQMHKTPDPFPFMDSFIKTEPSNISLKSPEKTSNKIVEKKHKINIDDEIETIEDLLTIIDKYEYKDDTEYNIDLQQIVKIKDELTSLNALIGIQSLKKSVLDQLLYFLQNLHLSSNGSDYRHTVLYGPPGTGKTEVAKIIGKMYSKIGVLKENTFIKATRQDLIAGYLGQTAIKTAKLIDDAKGGVLFIDEAYSLASSEKEDSFAKECLDTLCEALSNHKDDLMVIIAGYEEELNETFFRMNRGLKSRFVWKFTFDPYNAGELKKIYECQVKINEWECEELSEDWFKKNYPQFSSYGRDMEQLFTYTKICHSSRVYGKEKDLRKIITMKDLEKGLGIFMSNRKKKDKDTSYLYGIYV